MVRASWQCLAREKADGMFEKYGTALGLPEGYSADVVNPKVWQHCGQWFMVLGARDVNDRGCVLLYDATELGEWALRGVLAGSHCGGLRNTGICGKIRIFSGSVMNGCCCAAPAVCRANPPVF